MKFIKENLLQFALLISIMATIGSLYFSEIVKFPPCSLCWYQRLFMYPLVIVLAIGLWKKDKLTHVFALPFAIIGLLVSLYHNFLYYGFISESIQPCTVGTSCTEVQLEIFGYITIPLLSLIGFSAITILLLIHKKITSKNLK